VSSVGPLNGSDWWFVSGCGTESWIAAEVKNALSMNRL
jgi:hypothetical protein